jgi:hypothetical protein
MSPLLEQSTPASSRCRWRGTRSAFVDLIRSVEGSVGAAGQTVRTLEVKAGKHSGDIASADDLREAITEAMWLASDTIRVTLYSEGSDAANLTVTLEQPFRRYSAPALQVLYHSGTTQSRALLRMLIEDALPAEPADPRRHWRWLGPLVGLLWIGTLVLISSRIPTIPGVHAHLSTAARIGLFVAVQVYSIWYGCYLTRLLLFRWFPSLERLADTGATRWSRARMWVGIALGAWVTVIVGLLAVPPS